MVFCGQAIGSQVSAMLRDLLAMIWKCRPRQGMGCSWSLLLGAIGEGSASHSAPSFSWELL